MSQGKLILHSCIFMVALAAVLFLENQNLGITLHMFVYLCVATAFLKSLPAIRTSRKAFAMVLYYSLLFFQVNILILYDFSLGSRYFVAGLLLITFCLEQLFFHTTKQKGIVPMDQNSISFEEYRYLKQRIDYKGKRMKAVGEVVTLGFIRDMIGEFHRNAAVTYMAKDSLSDTYFENLEKSMSDPYVYLVFADTGSTASNFIGIFTNKPYNHLSISFDSQLKTLVSYNGGERVSPPGLNQEMIEWFYQKEDASIRIYRLKVNQDQKKTMAERVRTINREGSAYNLIGVAIGKSIQPNIMVCSEFVYGLLESVGANYFTKTALEVKPADMIELDYERKLEFVETIQLHTFCDTMVEKGKPLPEAGKPVQLNISPEEASFSG